MKVAVITGAASGIGLALSQTCLHQGVAVVMVDKDHAKLACENERLTEEFPKQIYPFVCDVTNPSEVSQLVQYTLDKLGQVDWLYNNAGIIGPLAPIWELNPASVQQVMNVNLFGMIHMIQAFMPVLFQQPFESHIINMASLFAVCTSSQTAPYSLSKHAVLALSETLYFDLKRLNKPVNVSVVFPSFTDTGLLTNTTDGKSSFHDALQSLLSHSRPALDIAQAIIQGVEQKKFYIFPDKEVKGYSEERNQAMLLQETPHATNVEKLISALAKRQEARCN